MNKEFEKLYKDYKTTAMFLSVLPPHIPEWDALVSWSKEHKKEAIDAIIEILEESPDDIVGLCDILFPDLVTYEGYTSLDFVCNTWLVILTAVKNGQALNTTNPQKFPDYYKDYRAYHKYMKDHYIPWNPFYENDPNVSLEEFKQGKRNDKEMLKKKLK